VAIPRTPDCVLSNPLQFIVILHLPLYSLDTDSVVKQPTEKFTYRILVGKPEGKRPLGRPRRRWVANIKMDLGKIGWDGRDWIELAQNRNQWRALVITMMNLRVP
jgi:hypothetical protein